MILFKKPELLKSFLRKDWQNQKSIGFVPTMGALHAGHASLIARSIQEKDLTVCSIFVNPVQFNNSADLAKYPRTIERDIELLISHGCDLLFIPSAEQMYPTGMLDLKTFELGDLENILEGASRPGHFKGVANVVDRFLTIIDPSNLYLGQKDFQQVKVIERMISISGHRCRIIMCPIVREASGLALSSRNVQLSVEAKNNASVIYKTLVWIKEYCRQMSVQELKQTAIKKINSLPNTKVDYIEFCNTQTFRPVQGTSIPDNSVAVTAVKVESVRLLDNILL